MKFRFGTASGEEIDAEQMYINEDELLQKLNAQVETFPVKGTNYVYNIITVDVNNMEELEELLNRFDILVMYRKGIGLVEKYPEIIWADVPIMCHDSFWNDEDEREWKKKFQP